MERSALVLFFYAMPLCGSLVLSFVWLGEPVPILAKTAASAFIIGLASFLTWFTLTLHRLVGLVRHT